MIKEKPIIFSSESINAILEGRKTQTRRVVKYQPPENYHIIGRITSSTNSKNEGCVCWESDNGRVSHYCKIPRDVGDILWVRETWSQLDMDYRVVTGKLDIDDFEGCPIVYRADDNPEHFNYWRPSIYMPRKAARLFLKVTNIRAERLQIITEEDARSEGCIDFHDKIGDGKFDDVAEFDLTARDAFSELWDNLNKKRGYGWGLNPWVYVLEFEKISEPIGQ
ncbi:conserved hypothetical protein [Candidatus Desulfosporosinus infrequens]|uniref:ASCH domain-containing protein n=1 Tax=Candidatus Desulfosporosinus infrequens TaxID=2043169 RepID=A0A2U3LH12_9FIRM|nr:conserved hypothetical protein [Candidatus Desulfosporosinus infrequens]